jgi:dienelactone hydrolase
LAAAAGLLTLAGCAVRQAPPDGARLESWRAEIRRTLSVPDPLPPLDPATHGGFAIDDQVRAERVEYGTQSGMRVPAILYLPRRCSGKIPGLLVVPGHGGDKYAWYAVYAGALYARAGAAVLTFDPAGEGERNSSHHSHTNAHDQLPPRPEIGRRLTGEMVTDVLQGVSYLRSRPEVDPDRVAVLGFSLGAYVAALAGAVDTRRWACVLTSGGNLDGPGGYWEQSRPLCQGFSYEALAFLGDRPAVLYTLHALRGPTLIVNGGDDRVIRMHKLGAIHMEDLSLRVERLRQGRGRLFEWRIVPGAGHQPFFLDREVAGWLEKTIDFPLWTPAEIASQQEIRIGQWAAANRVDLGHAGQGENRDAGTPALAAPVPALPREQLSLYSLPEWETQRNRLVLEAWKSLALGGKPTIAP